MCSASLDRVAHGIAAEEILAAADEVAGVNQMMNEAQQSSTTVVQIPTSAGGPQPSSTYATPVVVSNKAISNQTIALAHVLHKRNFSHSIKAIGQQKLLSGQEDQKKSVYNQLLNKISFCFKKVFFMFLRPVSCFDGYNELSVSNATVPLER